MKTDKSKTVTEQYPNGVSLSFHNCELLDCRQSQFQLIEVFDHPHLGKLLFIDKMIMFSEMDYRNNREMMVNISAHCRPEFSRALIIGGGDGSSPGEALKYHFVRMVDVVDVDEQVTTVCRKHLSMFSECFENPRLRFIFSEGLSFVREMTQKVREEQYGIIVVSPTDPDSLSKSLFSRDFFEYAIGLLDDDGVLCIGGFSPYYDLGCLTPADAFSTISRTFPIVRVFIASVPTYPGGLAAYLVASKKHDPAQVYHRPLTYEQYADMQYYTPELHQAAFVLPNVVRKTFNGITESGVAREGCQAFTGDRNKSMT